MTQSAFQAWIIGSPAGCAGMRDLLEETGIKVSQFSDLPTSSGDVPLVCVILDHPDQFSTRAIRQFLATFSYARIIVVLSEWCASLQRSRADWPLSVTIDRDSLRARLQDELRVIRGEAPPLPLTAGREEIADRRHCGEMPVVGNDGIADVVSSSKFPPVGEWLSELTPRLVLLLALVMAGCNPSPPAQLKDAAKTPTWTEQVEAVRRGERHAITVSEPVSASDWSLLATGCEGVEVLEADQIESKMVDFGVLRSMSGLRRLKLGGDVTDQVAAVIGQLPSLSELLIASDSLTDSGVAHFASLPLVQLRLQAPRLTDTAMTEIGKLASLRFLHLVGVPVTDAGLPPLVGVKTLESLYLDGAKCTEDGLSAFLKQRPDIHFHRDQMHLKDDPQGHAH